MTKNMDSQSAVLDDMDNLGSANAVPGRRSGEPYTHRFAMLTLAFVSDKN
jgi:hypothetical protein